MSWEEWWTYDGISGKPQGPLKLVATAVPTNLAPFICFRMGEYLRLLGIVARTLSTPLVHHIESRY